MAIVVPISIILLLSLIMNSVFILIQLPNSLDQGQSLTRSIFNETVSIEYSYNKIMSKLMIPAIKDLFVAQQLLSQNYHIMLNEPFQFYQINSTLNDPDIVELVDYLKQFKSLIKNNISVLCENGLLAVYGNQNISDYQTFWQFQVKNCVSKHNCIVLDAYSQKWIKPEFLPNGMKFTLLVKIMGKYKCSISEIQSLEMFVSLSKSWDPKNIYRGLLLNSYLYQVNSDDALEIGNLSVLSRTYVNQTENWIQNLYESLNDCSFQFRTFEYVGIDQEIYICRSTLFFVSNPIVHNCGIVDINEKKNFSILFIETFSLKFRNEEAGSLEESDKINQYITILFISSLIIFLYTWRQGVKASLSFVVPLRLMAAKILEQSVIDLSKQNFTVNYYDEYRNSTEIRQFIDVVIDYTNSVKYQSNQFELNAEGLMLMSNSKKFFKKKNNLSAVGLCSNNIARIHAINKRFLEALNEQEESIQIAEQELQSLLQLNELHQKMSTSRNWFKVYESFKSRLLSKFVGDDRIFERLQSQNYQPQLSKMISMEFKQRSNTMQQNVKRNSYASSNTERNRINNQLQNLNITSIALLQQIDKSNQSVIKEDSVIEEDCKNIVKLKLLNRQYQLLRILSQFSNEHDQLFLNEILQLLLQMKAEAEQQKPTSAFLNNLQFNLSCQLVYFYTKSNQISKAKSLLKHLPNLHTQQINQMTNSINIFTEVPIILVQSKITLLKAIIDIKMNKIVQSCSKLLSILSMSMYDPYQYNYAFKLLQQIFYSYRLNINLLEQFHITHQHIQAIILIDYTNQMTVEQIKLSHSITKYILSLFTTQDQVGLYAINSTFHQIFPLQQYQSYLQNSCNRLLLPPGGESNLLYLLQLAAGSFFIKNKSKIKDENTQLNNSNQSIQNERSIQHSLSNAGDVLDKYLQTDYHDKIEDEEEVKSQLRIIVLFAEMVKDYTQQNIEILKQIMNKRKIHIIIVQIANQNLNRIYLEALADLTPQSCILKQNQIVKYFQQLRPSPYIKKEYIEFF
ncbi:unnamed protein product [Paramecium pentaurelia]|uniref:Uncharacterized protein n=1 Tax=Paramecium pentaurelia TaxID=43138 RepID=A0A8S1XFK1_9CILI|nr:unnamed protein product [Paramecium pentaurelia]